jgi:hypothetical protein
MMSKIKSQKNKSADGLMKNIKEFYIRVKAPYNSHIKKSYAGYRAGRNLALYQARGGTAGLFFRGLPFRNKADAGKQSCI